jgi:poly(A) polymerase
VAQPRFRAGFDFMRLRADIGEVEESLASWWQEFQNADDARRDDLIAQARDEQRARQRSAEPKVHRVPKVRQPRDGVNLAEGVQPEDPAPAQAGGEEAAAPKKRRRRRRKPQGGGDGGMGCDE